MPPSFATSQVRFQDRQVQRWFLRDRSQRARHAPLYRVSHVNMHSHDTARRDTLCHDSATSRIHAIRGPACSPDAHSLLANLFTATPIRLICWARFQLETNEGELTLMHNL